MSASVLRSKQYLGYTARERDMLMEIERLREEISRLIADVALGQMVDRMIPHESTVKRLYEEAKARERRQRQRVKEIAILRRAWVRNLSETGMSYKEIGALIGVTRQRIQQMLKRAEAES